MKLNDAQIMFLENMPESAAENCQEAIASVFEIKPQLLSRYRQCFFDCDSRQEKIMIIYAISQLETTKSIAINVLSKTNTTRKKCGNTIAATT